MLAVIVVLALVVWSVWAYLTYEIGARLMPTARTQADVGQLLRTLGFASAPGVLRVFGIIPGATTPVFVVTELWMLMAMIVAIRQALDYTSTARAAAVCALSWVLAVALGARAPIADRDDRRRMKEGPMAKDKDKKGKGKKGDEYKKAQKECLSKG